MSPRYLDPFGRPRGRRSGFAPAVSAVANWRPSSKALTSFQNASSFEKLIWAKSPISSSAFERKVCQLLRARSPMFHRARGHASFGQRASRPTSGHVACDDVHSERRSASNLQCNPFLEPAVDGTLSPPNRTRSEARGGREITACNHPVERALAQGRNPLDLAAAEHPVCHPSRSLL